ncbi:hypothetical protein SAMN05192551_11114 [Tindallia magadiensis]|uniref:Uncharacterized protein n=1 Tax=Tindallia magadiensis TaxID=69895 RepID=A0A1I3H166_9FIRM|nr:hypothetical protein [Tindallia magadiensis]SFI29366.1 hypothetical protein SAMN05192551_11114 [Tindallia magadiensis]
MIDMKDRKTMLVLLITLCWVLITFSGWFGYWFFGLCLAVVLMLLHMVLGSVQNDQLSKKMLIYPLLSWTVLWLVGFYIAEHYAQAFEGVMPSFTVLGFHPSFGAIIIAYWIGGLLTLTVGLNLYASEWLSEDSWNDFKAKIEKLNQEQSKV